MTLSGLGGAGLARLEALERWRTKVTANLVTLTDRSLRAERLADAAKVAADGSAAVATEARVRAVASNEAVMGVNRDLTELEARVTELERVHRAGFGAHP